MKTKIFDEYTTRALVRFDKILLVKSDILCCEHKEMKKILNIVKTITAAITSENKNMSLSIEAINTSKLFFIHRQ